MIPTRYFIRCDDIGARTAALERLVETFLAARLPVSYQIIPLNLTDHCAHWLGSLRTAHPDLIEFGQHGLRHSMYVNARKVWREFGPERSYHDQHADICEGIAVMEAAFGPTRLFTPPQHKYDRNTLRAAAAAGHRIFSAASYTSPHHRTAYALGQLVGLSSIRHHGISRNAMIREDADLLELSIAIAIDNGAKCVVEPELLRQGLMAAARVTRYVGVMLHPEVYASCPATLSSIAQCLAQRGTHNFALLTELAAQIGMAQGWRPQTGQGLFPSRSFGS